jgi:hypothetical protein
MHAGLDDFASAADELGWEETPIPEVTGARAAWIPDDGGEVVWIQPDPTLAPVLRLQGQDLHQLQADLGVIAQVLGPDDLIDAIASAPDRSSLIDSLRLAGLLARGEYDPVLGRVLAGGLTAGDSEIQAAVAEGLQWTDWRELLAPIESGLKMSPIGPQTRARLKSVAARLAKGC